MVLGWNPGTRTERITEASVSLFVYRRHTWVPGYHPGLRFLRKGGEGHCHRVRASVNGRHMKTAQEIASWGNKDQVSEVIEPLTKVFPVLKPSWTPASRVSSTAGFQGSVAPLLSSSSNEVGSRGAWHCGL